MSCCVKPQKQQLCESYYPTEKGDAMKKKILLIGLMCVVFAACGLIMTGCGGGGGGDDEGGSADQITMRLASDAPEDHIATGINNWLCDEVEKRTEGRVKIDYYPSSQLGDYGTVYDEIKQGTIDAGQMTVPDESDKRLSMPYIPYYATSFEEAAILYGPDSYMTKTFAQVLQDQGVTFEGFLLEGFIGLGSTVECPKAKEYGEKQGVKIRAAAPFNFSLTVKDYGFDGVTIAYSETPTAIQTNVVQGWIGGTANMNYAWVADTIKYFYFNKVHAEATNYMISNKTLEKLSDEDREIVEATFHEASEMSFTKADENEHAYMDKMRDKGIEVVEFTDEEVQANAEKCREMTWPKIEKEYGKEVMDGLKADIEALQK